MAAASEAYDQAQARIGDAFQAEWAAVLAATTPARLAMSMTSAGARYRAAIRAQARASRALAISYYRLRRALETGRAIGGPGYTPGASLGSLWQDFNRLTGKRTGTGPRTPLPVDRLDPFPAENLEREAAKAEKAFRESVAEPVRKHEAERGSAALDDAELVAWEKEFMDSLRDESGAAGEKVARDEGRGVIHEALPNDPGAVGYYRELRSPKPCYRCLMVASMGAVYKSRASAGFRYHLNCKCRPQPIFSRNYTLPAVNARAVRLWKQFKEATGGGDQEAWRTWLHTSGHLKRPPKK
ncbi:VG15 protein [Kitasatospora purpeofusca]|uniref:VG15 protein n=1 Tax=Kitasatospora purpeofusca TaxID=67352 RepID=UPI00368B605F